MHPLRLAGTLAFCFLLLGCFQTETVVRVNPDGTGLIEETLLLSNTALESMQHLTQELQTAMTEGKPEDKPIKKDPLEEMIREAQKKADRYGPGVRFVSAVPLRTETMGGYKAVYAFEDINTIQIDQNPANKVEKGEGLKTSQAKIEEPIRFKLDKGPRKLLTVTLPKGQEKEHVQAEKISKPEKKEADPQAAEMMKTLFKDMGMKVSVKINGTILKTNATYRNESAIDLFEVNFGKVMGNLDGFEKLSRAAPKSIEDMKALAKGLEGLKIEMNNPVWVEFK
jgi:hypothetical protein